MCYRSGDTAFYGARDITFHPPGDFLHYPPAASYAHVVIAEDRQISGLKRQTPLFASSCSPRIGLSEPMPTAGPEWVNYGPWTRRVRVDLAQMRKYEGAARAATGEFLAGLKPEDLDTTLDLSGIGMGQQTLAWALSLLVIGHINNLAGEISCLKGLQGAKGYPF